jgi:hypothetical protein
VRRSRRRNKVSPTADRTPRLPPDADREQSPLAEDALQLVRPPIIEFDPRSEHQIFDRGSREDLAWPSKAHDPGSDVYRQPSDVVANQLDLTRMYSGPDLQSRTAHLGTDRLPAPHGPGRPIEGR